MADDLTAGEYEGPWPEYPRYVVWPVIRLPSLKPGDLDRSEAERDLDCMRDGIPLSVRLRSQIFPRRGVRNCCEYHSVDWHRASAVAIDVARRVPEAPTAWNEDPNGEFSRQAECRISELLSASGLAGAERHAAASLLWSDDGIILKHVVGTRQLSYTGGMHRAHALLIAGVRRTVIIRTRCCQRDWNCG